MLEVNRGCNPVIIIAITAAVSLKHDMYGFPATLQKKPNPERTLQLYFVGQFVCCISGAPELLLGRTMNSLQITVLLFGMQCACSQKSGSFVSSVCTILF